MRKYRFFYHYNKPHRRMSVHFRGTCYIVDDVDCRVPCHTKHRDRQPHIVMEGWATDVLVDEDMGYNQTTAVIE